jgi:hypothetical protein
MTVAENSVANLTMSGDDPKAIWPANGLVALALVIDAQIFSVHIVGSLRIFWFLGVSGPL